MSMTTTAPIPHIPFTRLIASPLAISTTPTLLASRAVLDGQARGRCGIEIINTTSAPLYIGDSTVDATHGLIIPAGTSRYLPITRTAQNHLHITSDTATTITLVEYFS